MTLGNVNGSRVHRVGGMGPGRGGRIVLARRHRAAARCEREAVEAGLVGSGYGPMAIVS